MSSPSSPEPAAGDRQTASALGEALSNVLSNRLRRLEEEGLVIAEPYQERPARFVYEATAPGRELAGALRLLAGWGARRGDEGERPRHEACGSALEARLWCPTCERTVEEDASDELDFA
jgi:DNA-binding PadR family transcriptional regulator